jgi:hypothetical protein
MATSCGSPSATILAMRAEGPKESESLFRVARVNSGASSSSEVFMAVELITFTSFGTAEPRFDQCGRVEYGWGVQSTRRLLRQSIARFSTRTAGMAAM